MAKRKPHARSSSSGAALNPDTLRRFIAVLHKATELFEEDVKERRWGGNAALLAEIQKARAFYAQAAHGTLQPVSRMTSCCVVDVLEVSWLEKQEISRGLLRCFRGPLSTHEDFQRVFRMRLGEESPYQLHLGLPTHCTRVGDRWTASANSRDENHDRYDYEIKAIYSLGA